MGINNRDKNRRFKNDGVEYKVCTKCNESFPNTEEFFFKSGHKTTEGKPVLRGDCKGCKSTREKEIRRVKYSDWKEYKLQLSCQDCGFPTEEDKKRFGDLWVYALEFNHRDPSTKMENISTMVGRFGYDRLMEEVAKCDVVCANCHRIHTFKNSDATKAA